MRSGAAMVISSRHGRSAGCEKCAGRRVDIPLDQPCSSRPRSRLLMVFLLTFWLWLRAVGVTPAQFPSRSSPSRRSSKNQRGPKVKRAVWGDFGRLVQVGQAADQSRQLQSRGALFSHQFEHVLAHVGAHINPPLARPQIPFISSNSSYIE